MARMGVVGSVVVTGGRGVHSVTVDALQQCDTPIAGLNKLNLNGQGVCKRIAEEERERITRRCEASRSMSRSRATLKQGYSLTADADAGRPSYDSGRQPDATRHQPVTPSLPTHLSERQRSVNAVH